MTLVSKYTVFKGQDYNKMATGTTSNTAFEYAHNQVHHTIGGFNTMDPGHMGVFAFAAFDPILYKAPSILCRPSSFQIKLIRKTNELPASFYTPTRIGSSLSGKP
jgi:hypothetical protein